ncbi:MAG TPA: FtsQ-type POTRA domain-containing protein [Actinomycetota bacterium]
MSTDDPTPDPVSVGPPRRGPVDPAPAVGPVPPEAGAGRAPRPTAVAPGPAEVDDATAPPTNDDGANDDGANDDGAPGPPGLEPTAPTAAAAVTDGQASQGPAARVRPRRLATLVVAAALVIAGGLFAATFTSFFAADAIRVRGIHHLTKGQVLRLSGLERGVNVFHLDPAAVERRIETDPWVAGATVTKDLPSTVILTIRERVPVAVVNDGSVERLVGDDGELLAVGAPSNLPRIVADDGATTTDPAAVRGAARAVSAMRPEIRRLVAFVVLLPEGELALQLRSGVPVAYGPAEDEASKAQALAAMLRLAERTGGRYTSMDVSVPTAPAGTLVGGSEPT